MVPSHTVEINGSIRVPFKRKDLPTPASCFHQSHPPYLPQPLSRSNLAAEEDLPSPGMDPLKFSNGTTDRPDLENMRDLRVPEKRGYEIRNKLYYASYSTRTNPKITAAYRRYCSIREVYNAFDRDRLPATERPEYQEEVLYYDGVQRHINRIVALMAKVRERSVTADAVVLASCPASARVRSEETQALVPADEDTRAVKRKTLQPTDRGATEEKDILPQPSSSDATTSVTPSQTLEDDSALKTLAVSASGVKKVRPGVIDNAALHDNSWDMVEAMAEDYDNFTADDVLVSPDVEDEDVDHGEETADWDLCG
ncbi:MAG: hypothetical protein LQ346_008180 [Caloplaca aetnensis]|nr:MAG: hypothetical protein LQ346_008180 [Caloplaca aetnensis]